MDLADYFARQLTSTLEGFAGAIEQIPAERRHQSPPSPNRLGQWSPARHVFHLLTYEHEVALPSMRHWLGGPKPDDARFVNEDASWDAEGAGQSIEAFLQQLRAVRAEQISLLPRFSSAAWETVRDPIPAWRPVTLRWIVTKTLQHTAEHTNDALRLVIFWDWALQDATSEANAASATPRAHTPE